MSFRKDLLSIAEQTATTVAVQEVQSQLTHWTCACGHVNPIQITPCNSCGEWNPEAPKQN